MKVSFICVYNKDYVLNKYLKESLSYQSEEFELILIDNRNFSFGNAATALNCGAKIAKGDYLIFVHQDIKLTDPNWISKTIKQIKDLENPGIIGISGKSNDLFVRTNIKQGIPPKPASPFKLRKIENAVSINDCLLIIPRETFNVLKFDEKNCPGWYLYGLDYLLSAKKLGFKNYLIPSHLEHYSKSKTAPEDYYKTLKKLQKKHFSEKILRDEFSDWFTYIPISIQRNIKERSKLQFINRLLPRLDSGKHYHKIHRNVHNLIKNSGFFDEKYYKAKYGIDSNKYDPLTHYGSLGYWKNYNPSRKFDTYYYKNKYSDVKQIGINPLEHYLRWGHKEGRTIKSNPKLLSLPNIKHKILTKTTNPTTELILKSKLNPKLLLNYKKQYNEIKDSALFDSALYKKKYKDLKPFENNPLLHYIFIGQNNHYQINNFIDETYYYKKYGSQNSPAIMYLENESDKPVVFKKFNDNNYEIIEESGLFDKDYYLRNYPETKKYESNLIAHYYHIGYKKGFDPSAEFNTTWYLDTYLDVKNANMNPLIHYILYGKEEERLPRPINETEANEIIEKINLNAKNTVLKEFGPDSPLISIVILTRDGIDYLKTLFENFEKTICYPNYEIIVVDNDSSDDSVKYLKKLSKTLPITVIENKENETFSEANNKAVMQSNGEYIVLLNNDMEPVYGWLNQMMQSYLKSDDIGIVGAKLIYPYREDNPTSLTTQNEGIKYTELDGFLNKNDGYIVPFNIKENNVFEENEEDREIASVLGAAILIKKDLYLEVGGLDDHYFYNYEDIDLCFKVIEKGYKVIYSPKSKLYHYYQATRQEAFDLSPKDIKNRTYLYRIWNEWLSEKLFMDRLENKLIFSEKPLNLFYISDDFNRLEYDELISETDWGEYEYTEKFSKLHNGITIEKLGWELTPLLNNHSKIHFGKNGDIFISDIPFNPNKIKKHNKHQIKVAIVENNFNKWLKNNLKSYDIILTKEYYAHILDDENVFILNDNSIFEQIKDIIVYIHENNLSKFNEMIKNLSFEESITHGEDYLAILNSEYFDDDWYCSTYDEDKEYFDPVTHYLDIGWKKGFDPSTKFSNKRYLEANPDVRNAKINPLLHYEKYGRDELRQIECSKEELDSYNEFLTLKQNKNYKNKSNSFKTKPNQIFFFSPWSDEKHGELNENSQMIYDMLDEKYDKKTYTYSKHPHIGDNMELLHNLLESKVIILDQGWGWLSEIELNADQKVINIWHACGAFKKIGYDSPVYSDNQLERFGKQFKQYSNFIVSSPKIEDIYANAHGMNKKDVLGLGVPRTDIFYDANNQKEKLDEFFKKYPELKDKEIILYAPTFRDEYTLNPKINWKKLSETLDSNEIFIIKRHIMTTEDILNGESYNNIIYLEDESLFTLMYASKLMITDYSSVIFEYSLLNKPVIHYCPDYEEYLKMRDFYLDFDTELYGKIIKDPHEFIEIISKKDYETNVEKLDLFKEKFMSACDGNATERVVKLIEGYLSEKKI